MQVTECSEPGSLRASVRSIGDSRYGFHVSSSDQPHSDIVSNQASGERDVTFSVPRLVLVVYTLLAFIALTSFLIVVVGATHLRPASDDYWLALVARKGPFGSIGEWWLTWSGDLVVIASNSWLGGMPLLYLPWPLASATAYLISAAVVGVAAAISLLAIDAAGSWPRRLLLLLILVMFFAVQWWVFLWSPLALGETAREQIVLGMTHWQNLNTAYVIPPVAILIAWTALSRSALASRMTMIVALLLGLAAGLAGPVFGAAAVAWLASFGIVVRAAGIPITPRQLRQGVGSGIGAAIGLLISHYSPGSRSRQTVLVPAFDWTANQVGSFLQVFAQAGADVSGTLRHEGTLLVFVVVAGAVGITARAGYTEQVRTATSLARAGGLLLTFALIYAAVNRLSEIFVGYYYWHITTLQVLIFLSLMLLSSSVGMAVGRRLDNAGTLVVALSVVASALVGVGAVQTAANSMVVRQSQWDVGPAPIEGVVDDVVPSAEDDNGAWHQMLRFRNGPARGLE